MSVQAKHITSILSTFSTFLETFNVSKKLTLITTEKFIVFIKNKKNLNHWSYEELETFVTAQNISPKSVALIKKFITDYTPYQVDVFLHDFLASLKTNNKSNSTIKNYRSDISQFISLTNTKQIKNLFDPENLRYFVDEQLKNNLQISTVKRKLTSISQFALWAESEEIVSDASFWISDVESLLTGKPIKKEQANNSVTKTQVVTQKNITNELKDYLLSLEIDGHSKSTVKNYKSDITQFIKFSKKNTLTELINPAEITLFCTAQKKAGLKDLSIKRKLTSISGFSIWAEKRGSLENISIWIHHLPGKLFTQEKIIDPKQDGNSATNTGKTKTDTHKNFELRLKTNELVHAHDKKINHSKAWSLPIPSFASREKQHSLKDINTPANLNKKENSSQKEDEENTKTYSKIRTSLQDFSEAINSKRNKRFLPYFNLLMIFVFVIGLGIFGYQQFIKQAPAPFAYPSTPVRPARELSFQGRLTDTAQNPITSATNMAFRLYDNSSGGTLLWNSSTCSVTPDQDGIFNVGLGDTCGSEITEDVFTENSNVWLEVEIASETLTPRQSIKTVAYALNSETVQGYPVSATGAATINTILTMDSGGQILLGEVSPTLKATTGTFSIEAQALSIETSSGSNGNITLTPDGTGTTSVLSDLDVTGYLTAPGATISATYAGGTALVVKGGPTGTANIQEWQNSAGTVLSVVDENGNIGIGSSSPISLLNITGAAKGKALAILDETGDQDILTASSSGTTRFRLANTGYLYAERFADISNSSYFLDPAAGGTSLSVSGNIGVGSITPAAALDIVGDIYLSSGLSTFGTAVSDGTIEATQFCTGDGETNCVSDFDAVTSLWTNTLNVYHPKNEYASIVDLVLGGTSTASADIQLFANGSAIFNEQGADVDFRVEGVGAANAFFVQGSDGNVGIGSSAPAADLDVFNGNIRANSLLASNGSGQNIAQYNGTNFLYGSSGALGDNLILQIQGEKLRIQSDGNVGIGTTTPVGLFNVEGAVTGKALAILNETGNQNIFVASASGTNRFVIQNDGNIGIGTSYPGYTLDLAGELNLTDAIRIAGDAGNLGYLLTSSAGGANTWTDPESVGIWDNTLNVFHPKDEYASIVDLVLGGTSTASANVHLQSNGQAYFGGNVGIGISSPTSELDVSNTGATEVKITSSDGLGDQILHLRNASSGVDWKLYGESTNNFFNISREDVDLVTINNSGNFGIGSAIPGYKLEVVGEFNLTDAIRVAGDAGTSGYLLTSSAGGAMTWTDPTSLGGAGTSLWDNTLNVFHPKDEYASIVDLAIGGTSTASADIQLFANGSAIFNEQGADADFRVEGVGAANALFVQGSDGNVGIGTSTPSTNLDINGSLALSGGVAVNTALAPIAGGMIINRSVSSDPFILLRSGDVSLGQIRGNSASNGIYLSNAAGTEAYLKADTTGVTINEAGNDRDFRVEGVGAANAFFVQGSDGNVGIGTINPSELLDVTGNAIIGNQSSINYAAGNSVLMVNQRTTDTTQAVYGVQSSLEVNPATATTRNYYGGYFNTNSIAANINNYTGRLVGFQGQVDHYGTGTVTQARGFAGLVANQSTGTITTSYGGYFGNYNLSTGTMTNSHGLAVVNGSNAGTMTSKTGITVEDITGATNNTNLLLGTSTIPSGNYSIYNSSTKENYFAGNVGIGTTNPYTLAHIYDGASGQATPNADSNLVIESSGGNVLNMLAPNANYSAIYFGDVSSAYTGGIEYLNSANATSADTLRFKTAGTGVRMVIIGNGNVGIGTTDPSSFKLEVAGNVGPSADLSYSLGSPSKRWTNIYASGAISATGLWDADTDTGIQVEESTDEDFIRFDTAGTERMIINNTGNVGIGTTSPAFYNLTVHNASGDSVMGVTRATGASATVRATTSDARFGSETNHPVQIVRNQNVKITIDNNDNVGIGTTSPVGKLDIKAAVNGKALVQLQELGDQDILTASNSAGTTRFRMANTGYMYAERFADVSNSSYFLDPAAAGTSMAVISNVGIGTSSPNAKLDVDNTYTSSTTLAGAAIESSWSPSTTSGSVYPTGTSSVSNYNSAHTPAGGFLTSIRGVSQVQSSGSLGINNVDLYSLNTGTAALPYVRDIWIRGATNSGGGSITNYYGIYMSDQTAATNNYGIYQNGASVDNYFEGDIRVGANSSGAKIVVTPTVGESGINVISPDAGNTHLAYNGSDNYISYSSTGKTIFRSFTAGPTYATQMYIDGATGNIGIGAISAAPAAKLQIRASNAEVGLILGDNDGVDSNIRILPDNTDGYNYIQAGISSSDTVAKLRFSRFGTGTTNISDLEFYSDNILFSGDIISNGSIGVENGAVNHYRNVANYNNTISSVTGTMKIAMPKTWSNTMGTYTIKGYNYNTAGQWEVVVSGYNYTGNPTPFWVNYDVEIRGDAPFNSVRLAHDGTVNVILLGTTSTVWAYPKATVTDVIVGHTNYTGWETGWNMSIISSETGIASIATPTIHTYLDTSGNFGIGTTAPTSPLHVNKTNSASSPDYIGNLTDITQSSSGVMTAYAYRAIARATHTVGTLSGLQSNSTQAYFSGNGGTTSYGDVLSSGATIGTGATVSNLSMLKIFSPGNSGTIGALKGIEIQNMSAGGSNYSIWSAGGNMYHAGNIGIATTTAGAELDVNGIIQLSNVSGNLINHTAQSSYDKIRVWNNGNYTIGMASAQTYGYLADYAMTFTMSNTPNRGWLWRDYSDAASDGAMSLTTDGRLTVKSTARFTGEIIGSDNILSGYGSGGVAMTINDGYGNANLTFNHTNGVPEQTGNAARIEVNTDNTSDGSMHFELGTNKTGGVASSLQGVMTLKATGDAYIGLGSGSSGERFIKFSQAWSDSAQANSSEISNDISSYKTLMVIGNKSNNGTTRKVDTWDHFTVHGTFTNSSDIRLKENVLKVDNSLDKLTQLNGYSFNWKKTGGADMGVIAQEVELLFPTLVEESASDLDDPGAMYKTVSYIGLFAPVIESIKELKVRNETLKAQTDQTINIATESGLIVLKKDIDNKYIVTNSNNNTLFNKIGAFSRLILANIQAGFINTQELVVQNTATIKNLSVESFTINGQTLASYIQSVVGGQVASNGSALISPVGNDTIIKTASQSGQIAFTNNSNQKVATISAQGNLSLLGNIVADTANLKSITATGSSTLGSLLVTKDATISGTLTVNKVTANTTSLGSLLAQDATVSGTLIANQIDATSARITALEAGIAELEHVKATTADIVNATVSGTLYANDIYDFENRIATTLQQPGLLDILSGNSNNTVTQDSVTDLYDTINKTEFNASSAAQLDLSFSELSMTSDDVTLTGTALFIEKYFKVNGSGFISDSLAIGNTLFIGESMQIADGSINYTTSDPSNQTLRIQPEGQGSIELLAGIVTIDDSGKVTVNGNLEVNGNLKVADTLLTNVMKPTDFGNPLQVQVAGRNTEADEIKKSRFEIINEVGTPVATFSAEGNAKFAGDLSVAGKAEFEGGIYTSSIKVDSQDLGSNDANNFDTTKTSGKATIKAGANEVTIRSSIIKNDTLIYVTATGSTGNQVLYVKDQRAEDTNTPEQDGKFVVGFDNSTTTDVSFNWWIVN